MDRINNSYKFIIYNNNTTNNINWNINSKIYINVFIK